MGWCLACVVCDVQATHRETLLSRMKMWRSVGSGGQGRGARGEMKDSEQPPTVSGEFLQCWSAPGLSIWPQPASLTPDKPLSFNYQDCGTGCSLLTADCRSENREAKPLMKPSHSSEGQQPNGDRFKAALKWGDSLLAETGPLWRLRFVPLYTLSWIVLLTIVVQEYSEICFISGDQFYTSIDTKVVNI